LISFWWDGIIQKDKICLKKEVDTMAALKENENHAFILASDKVELFINQDNTQFKNAMERLGKVKKLKNHSVDDK
jgi:hypothetical protein